MSRFTVCWFVIVTVPEAWRQGVTLERLLVCHDGGDDEDDDVDGIGDDDSDVNYDRDAGADDDDHDNGDDDDLF